MIKICGITNLADAVGAVDAGATAIGFNFYPPSPRFISTEQAAGIATKLPAGIAKVGVFVDPTVELVKTIMAVVGLDIVQLHGSEAPDMLRQLGMPVWKAIRVTAGFTPHLLNAFPADAFLLDSPGALPGGNGTVFDWSIVRDVQKRFILAGGLDDGNVGSAIASVKPWGVDTCSRIEKSPGLKDHQKMAAFIQAALRASS